MKKVLVSIVNYNSRKHIEELILGLKNIDLSLVDICIVDNKSPSEDLENMIDFSKKNNIYFFQADKNWWFAYGNNEVVKYMTNKWNEYEYIFLINPDMLITSKTFFENIYSKMQQNNIDIWWPMICEYSNKNKIHFAWWFLKWPILFPTKLWRWEIDKWQYKDIECDYVNGSAMIIKYDLRENFWWMDESYFLYFEETDFCRKAKLLQKKIICFGDIKIYDKISWSVGRMSKLYINQMINNYKKFALKYIKWVNIYIWRIFYIFCRYPLFKLMYIKNKFNK